MAVARRRTTFNFVAARDRRPRRHRSRLERPLALRRHGGDREGAARLERRARPLRRASPSARRSRTSARACSSRSRSRCASATAITVGGETGFVEEMALIYTTLVTDDARRIFIPNTQLTTSTIVNRTIKDPRRLDRGAASPSRSRRRSTRRARRSSRRSPTLPGHERRERARARRRDQATAPSGSRRRRTRRSTPTSSRSRASCASAASARCATRASSPRARRSQRMPKRCRETPVSWRGCSRRSPSAADTARSRFTLRYSAV